jgi:hypothetical protein
MKHKNNGATHRFTKQEFSSVLVLHFLYIGMIIKIDFGLKFYRNP